jgi:hypothetical protein
MPKKIYLSLETKTLATYVINKQMIKFVQLITIIYNLEILVQIWNKTRGRVTLWPCQIYNKKKYLTMQKYDLQNNPLKETKILQDINITL